MIVAGLAGLVAHHFEGDGLLRRAVVSEEHLAHAALADDRHQLVAADHAARLPICAHRCHAPVMRSLLVALALRGLVRRRSARAFALVAVNALVVAGELRPTSDANELRERLLDCFERKREPRKKPA